MKTEKVTEIRERIRKQLLGDLTETLSYCTLKEEALDHSYEELAFEEAIKTSG